MQHIKREVEQGAASGVNILVPDPVLPSPNDWVWVITGDSYEPHW